MSNNFFAALDDSGDEAPLPAPAKKDPPSNKPAAKSKPASAKKDPPSNKPAAKSKPGVEPSKVDQRHRPNEHDRNTKYGRGGRAPTRDGKRAYDRRSGTGRGKEIKKDGGGARNWGSDKNEARRAQGVVDENAAEAPADDIQRAPEGDTPEAVEAEPEPEPEPEEDKTISYEDYVATKENPDNAAFAPKQQREVQNEFASMTVKAKADEEDFFSKEGGKQKKNKQKNKVGGNKGSNITPAFRVVDSTADSGYNDRRRDEGRGGGRGGRGGGRGRGGRGGYDDRGRGGRGGGGRGKGGNAGINLTDEAAFPSL